MSQQQSFPNQARPNGHPPQVQRAPNDGRGRGMQNGQNQHMNGAGPVAGVGVPVPRGPGNGHGNMNPQNGQGFAGARSPPNAKNTSHVPCKFFKQGQCQAGNTCPYSHAENIGPCKYFQKGNCKFGMRCANEHITPDGTVVDKRTHMNMAAHMSHGRAIPPAIQAQQQSLLSMQQDQFGPMPPMFLPGQDRGMQHSEHGMMFNSYDPLAEDFLGSSPRDQFMGRSPPQDYSMGRSPPVSRLSVLEAPLPASFDSQGISHIARYGPIAASVPARMNGFESSSPASSQSALRKLYSPAFGDGANNMSLLGMSPSGTDGPPQRMGARTMHSATYNRPRMLSSSVGNRQYLDMDEGDEGDDFEFNVMFEDAVPSALNDLLTPQERLRRLSRTAEDDSASNHRAAFSGLGTPSGESPKVGSPGNLGASPSRFGPLFRQQWERERAEANASESATNAFGHVGSPLRPSHLTTGSSPSLRPASGRPASGDFSISSPPRHASGSLISQHLQRNRLSGRAESSESVGSMSTLQHPGVQRVASGSVPIPPNRLDRSISTTSSTGVGWNRIDEGDELFAMDGLNISGDKSKRTSAGHSAGPSIGNSVWADVARSGAAKSAAINGQASRRNISETSNGNAGGP